jgi:CubicO group peptidase (beta-lactamase class C family)
VASVTKVFTVLALLLRDGLNLDSLAKDHVPELREMHQYQNITLRMLASQLSGVPTSGNNICFSLEVFLK